ncbi:MAG: acyltransferase family protein [Bacteroidales bacterium]|nr:acyltransferase family protein [Bacteroidales bacterium]
MAIETDGHGHKRSINELKIEITTYDVIHSFLIGHGHPNDVFRHHIRQKTYKDTYHKDNQQMNISRTRKLLVPSTIGLFVFHWMVGYFNTIVAERLGLLDGLPLVVKYSVLSISGIGPLWFIQLLWLLCIVLLLIRLLDAKDKLWAWCGKANYLAIIVIGALLFWAGEHTLIQEPRPESLDGLLNLYKPLFYLVPFLLGYFVFSHDEVQVKVTKIWKPLMAVAVISGVVLTVTTFGENNTSPQYLGSPLNCLYGWLMCLAMMGWFKACFDYTGSFAGYMMRSSFGLYIVHYLVIAGLGYTMKIYTQLPPWTMYLILTVAVFALSPLIYEIIRRIPVIRWCVLGEKSI